MSNLQAHEGEAVAAANVPETKIEVLQRKAVDLSLDPLDEIRFTNGPGSKIFKLANNGKTHIPVIVAAAPSKLFKVRGSTSFVLKG